MIILIQLTTEQIQLFGASFTTNALYSMHRGEVERFIFPLMPGGWVFESTRPLTREQFLELLPGGFEVDKIRTSR